MKNPHFRSFLSSVMDQYMKRFRNSLKEETCDDYCRMIASFDDYLFERSIKGPNISVDIIDGWTKSIMDILSQNTVQGYQYVVFGFLRFAEAFKVHSVLPDVISSDQTYIPHVFTDQERSALHSNADNYIPTRGCPFPWVKAEIPMILRILDSCGTRVTETLKIKMRDVDTQSGILTILSAKGNNERIVPIHPDLNELLKGYCLAMGLVGNPDAFLFPGRNRSEAIDRKSFRVHFLRLLNLSGITVERKKKYEREICVHCLRHTFICRSLDALLESGLSEVDAHPYLSTYVGHADLYSTEHYLQYPIEKIEKDAGKYESYVDTIYNIPLFNEDVSEWQ